MEQNMDEICMELKRKELQYVAKNFLESKANAKSETIVQEIKNYALIGEEEYEKMIHFLANLPKELKLQTPKSTKKTRIVDSSARRSIRASTRKLDKIVVEEESHDDVRKELNLHDEDSDMDENVENSIVEPEEEKSIEMELVKELCPSTCSPCEMDVPEMKGQDASCPMDQDKDDAGCNGTMGDVAINDSEVKSAQQVDSENFVEKDKNDIQELISSMGNLAFTSSGDRVRCSLTGHEMKVSKDDIAAYLSGKKYKKALSETQGFAEFLPNIVPDEDSNCLICLPTGVKLPRDRTQILKHINGKKYMEATKQA